MKFKVESKEKKEEKFVSLSLSEPDRDGDVFLRARDSEGSAWSSILWVSTDGEIVLDCRFFQELARMGFSVSSGKVIVRDQRRPPL